jgi:hypothetical protein
MIFLQKLYNFVSEVFLESLKTQKNHRQPNVMVACAQAHVAQAMDCIVVLFPQVGKCTVADKGHSRTKSEITPQ